jgi:hypothetical protein
MNELACTVARGTMMDTNVENFMQLTICISKLESESAITHDLKCATSLLEHCHMLQSLQKAALYPAIELSPAAGCCLRCHCECAL